MWLNDTLNLQNTVQMPFIATVTRANTHDLNVISPIGEMIGVKIVGDWACIIGDEILVLPCINEKYYAVGKLFLNGGS